MLTRLIFRETKQNIFDIIKRLVERLRQPKTYRTAASPKHKKRREFGIIFLGARFIDFLYTK